MSVSSPLSASSSPILLLLLPSNHFSLLPFLGEQGWAHSLPLGGGLGRGLLIYFFLLSFISLSYSFLVMRMNEPCWGAVTPSMSTGSWKLRRWLSALQMR